MTYFVEFKYKSDVSRGETGHTAGIISPEHLEEILERYHITPDRLTSAKVNGQEIAPGYLSEYIHFIFEEDISYEV